MTILFTILMIIISLAVVGVLVMVWLIFRILRRIFEHLANISKKNDENFQKVATTTDDSLGKIFQLLKEQTDDTQNAAKHVPNAGLGAKQPQELHRKVKEVRMSDSSLGKLIEAYQALESGQKFVPISKVIDEMVERDFAENRKDAIELINSLLHRYPRVVRVEDVRGSKGKHLAIYKEMLQ